MALRLSEPLSAIMGAFSRCPISILDVYPSPFLCIHQTLFLLRLTFRSLNSPSTPQNIPRSIQLVQRTRHIRQAHMVLAQKRRTVRILAPPQRSILLPLTGTTPRRLLQSLALLLTRRASGTAFLRQKGWLNLRVLTVGVFVEDDNHLDKMVSMQCMTLATCKLSLASHGPGHGFIYFGIVSLRKYQFIWSDNSGRICLLAALEVPFYRLNLGIHGLEYISALLPHPFEQALVKLHNSIPILVDHDIANDCSALCD